MLTVQYLKMTELDKLKIALDDAQEDTKVLKRRVYQLEEEKKSLVRKYEEQLKRKVEAIGKLKTANDKLLRQLSNHLRGLG